MEIKKCSRCGRELPITEFNWADKAKGRRQGVCRSCFSRYNKARYASNSEKFKADVKRYRTENPEKLLETRLKTNDKCPTKLNARKCVEAAVACGAITRPSVCWGCGCNSSEHRIEAHHHDYARPLDVIWLCTPCHRQMDARRRKHEGLEPFGKRKQASYSSENE